MSDEQPPPADDAADNNDDDAGSPPLSSTDHRLQWFASTITDLLGIEDTAYARAAIDEHSERIAAFFGAAIRRHADARKQIVFVWRTFYDRMVEEVVVELQEVRPETPPPPPPSKKKGKAVKAGKKGTAASAAAAAAAGADKPEPVFVEVERVVQTFVKTPIVHMHFGPLEARQLNADANYFYAIRKNSAPIRKCSVSHRVSALALIPSNPFRSYICHQRRVLRPHAAPLSVRLVSWQYDAHDYARPQRCLSARN